MDNRLRFTGLALAFFLSACSSPALLLDDSGTILLEAQSGNAIELPPGREIALFWRASGIEDSTSAAERTGLLSGREVDVGGGGRGRLSTDADDCG